MMTLKNVNDDLGKFNLYGGKVLTLPYEHPVKSSVPFHSCPFHSCDNRAKMCRNPLIACIFWGLLLSMSMFSSIGQLLQGNWKVISGPFARKLKVFTHILYLS